MKIIKQYTLLVLHWLSFVGLLFLGIKIALYFKPEPTMDSRYYWALATDLSIYHKGGLIGIWLLPLKWLSLKPYEAALVMNGVLLFFTYCATMIFPKISNWKQALVQLAATLGSAMFAFWFSGYLGIINADFTNVALIIISLRLFYGYLQNGKKVTFALGLFTMFFAISFRVKTGLALGGILVFLVLFGFKHLMTAQREKVLVIALAILLIGAAGIEVGLRVQSEAKVDVARQGRLQLYTGLLDTSVGPMCGRWTREAYEKTLEDLDLSIFQVFEKHLGVKSKRYIVDIVLCKLKAIVGYTDFSYNEIIPVGVQYRPVTTGDYDIIRKYEPLEDQLVSIFKWMVYGMMLVTFVIGSKYRMLGRTLPIFVYFTFLALHAVFEIQARYMVEPLMWTYFSGVLVFAYEVWLKSDSIKQTRI